MTFPCPRPVEFHSNFSRQFKLSLFYRDSFSAEEKVSQQAKELNNGRAAMMGILALFVHEKLGVSILPF